MFNPNSRPPDDVPEKKRAAPKSKFLIHNPIFEEEKVGDYIGGNKIPSLMEFLENKMINRQSVAKTLVPNRGYGPKPLPHRMPRCFRQDLQPKHLEKIKDSWHDNITFRSEWERLEPEKKVPMANMDVEQPLLS